MNRAAHTDLFAHLDRVMTAEAHRLDDRWEMVIRDEDGRVRCAWRPDMALLAGDAERIAPSVLQMMISMVRNGLLPLDHEGRPGA
ncbi:hypothetical protein [Roseomonas populi]|uniref:DUF2470 domain-containing protein n=1 Tax=Roseomonas populi TaxID=3121582 RepID=A0ABT1XAP4_9PROT|nr:hypothetical protein [Roseomonas pecuniae]MCR0985185.1 hypothetical protein [Roseomonas pecuniae]